MEDSLTKKKNMFNFHGLDNFDYSKNKKKTYSATQNIHSLNKSYKKSKRLMLLSKDNWPLIKEEFEKKKEGLWISKDDII